MPTLFVSSNSRVPRNRRGITKESYMLEVSLIHLPKLFAECLLPLKKDKITKVTKIVHQCNFFTRRGPIKRKDISGGGAGLSLYPSLHVFIPLSMELFRQLGISGVCLEPTCATRPSNLSRAVVVFSLVNSPHPIACFFLGLGPS